jgi:hypothetical protein
MSTETQYAIPHSALLEWKALLEVGLENTQCALIEHDANLGRTTRKNREWAETLEEDIKKMRLAIGHLHERTIFGP